VRAVWLAVALAGCGVSPHAHSHTPAPARAACGGAVAPDHLGAVHFLTPEVGVGLTASGPPCPPMLAVSHDGGRHWLTEGSPFPGRGITEQLAATSTNRAWAAVGDGPLMATTTGGDHWTVQPVPGPIVSTEISGPTLWTLGCPHANNVSCRPALARKLLPGGVWRRLPVPKLESDPEPELALPSTTTALLHLRRPGASGGTLVESSDGGRHWTRRPNPRWLGHPCWGFGFTTAGPRDWWLICLGGAAAGSSTKALLHTTDRGARWHVASQVTSLTAPLQPGAITRAEPDAFAAASPTRLWLATQNSLYESDDGGIRWTWVPGPNPQGSPASFDVLSPNQAWLLAPGQGLWRTTDGRHWRAL
jgi:photosystem II stability/assembly factor-like uncharacterized protein